MKTIQFSSLSLLAGVTAALVLTGSSLVAQNAPPGAPGDRESFRQRMNERLKTTLKVTDEEWSIIQPLLEKVQTKQRETMLSRFAALGGDRRGRNNDRANRPEHQAAPEIDTLRAALENESTSPAEIKAKLEALRAAHKKSAAELEQAREELRKVLTLRQEAALVMIGVLE